MCAEASTVLRAVAVDVPHIERRFQLLLYFNVGWVHPVAW
jgi:hypothetical protein